MKNSPLRTVLQNSTMVGAITVLVTVLAVFLAYNANTGLPFVASYRVVAEVPNAESIVPGNEVRIGGVRVGLVESVDPLTQEDGTAIAQLGLKLDQDIAELPSDSTLVIRARSALGLKYLEIVRGDSDEGIPEGSTISITAAQPEPVEFDQLINTFDEPTRKAIRVNLEEFGDALAGRGGDLNETIGTLKELLPRLERVTGGLADPDTRLSRFFKVLTRSAAEVAPVAENQAQMFVALDRTFGAFADVARPFIQDSISGTPPTLRTTVETLPRIRPLLANTRGLFNDLRPGAVALADSADDIRDALVAGVPALEGAEKLNSQLAPTAATLRDLSDDATSRLGIDRLTELSDELTPTVRFIGPAQSVCNYATLLFRNLGSALAIGNDLGNWQRFILLDAPKGPNNEGGPSSGPANGPDIRNYLHSNPYPNTASPGQTKECEAGNEPYLAGQQVIGNVPGNQGTTTEGQE